MRETAGAAIGLTTIYRTLENLHCSEIACMEEVLSGHLLEEHGVEPDLQSSVIQRRCGECRAKAGAAPGGKPAA